MWIPYGETGLVAWSSATGTVAASPLESVDLSVLRLRPLLRRRSENLQEMSRPALPVRAGKFILLQRQQQRRLPLPPLQATPDATARRILSGNLEVSRSKISSVANRSSMIPCADSSLFTSLLFFCVKMCRYFCSYFRVSWYYTSHTPPIDYSLSSLLSSASSLSSSSSRL